MKMLPIINTSVSITNVGTKDQRDGLMRKAQLYKEHNPSISNTNDGCWRGEIHWKEDWLKDAIDSQLNDNIKYYLDIDPALKSRFNHTQMYVETWTNINDPGSMNRLHSHKLYDFVALYYIQGEGTGELVFHNPANLEVECSLNSPWVSMMSYEPKDGDLLIWPGWVPHEVGINKSNKQRVNIAFNIKL